MEPTNFYISYTHVEALDRNNIYSPFWLAELQHLAFVANCLKHFIHSWQGTEDFVNWQKIVGPWTFWMESLKFGYAWENFGTSKKNIWTSNVSLLTDFLQNKKKICIVWTGPKLYTCVTLLYNGTTWETGFPKLTH